MSNSKFIKARLIITCDVLVDDTLKENIAEQYNAVDDQEAAEQALYAFLYSKIPQENDLINSEGYWDGVCDFKGRFKNIHLGI
ncbi:hypothetical protein [Brevibacillus laterosporus]|uniref:hypothetical protein n=1 Tax=Brevibacillus laterosporus TaxID=1465 RepID=UPI000839BBEC|nr:hypothetical protein [Brevibacillus laterosporus]